jgi:hypothetical protein
MALIETEALRHSYRDGDALVWAVDGIGGISGVLTLSGVKQTWATAGVRYRGRYWG